MAKWPLVCMQTRNTNYIHGRSRTPLGVLWHSTGANNPNLKRYVQPFICKDLCGEYERYTNGRNTQTMPREEFEKLLARKENIKNTYTDGEWMQKLGLNTNGNDWNHSGRVVNMNCWIGKLADGTVTTVQTMPWGKASWGVGNRDGYPYSCDEGWIQFEICEDNMSDSGYFSLAYWEACRITAYICNKYHINPLGTVNFHGIKVPTILCHYDSYHLGLGNNHGDVYSWFKRHGKDMNNVRRDVAWLMGINTVKFSGIDLSNHVAQATPPGTSTENITTGAVSGQLPDGTSATIGSGLTISPQELNYGIAVNTSVSSITTNSAELAFSTNSLEFTKYSWAYRIVNLKTNTVTAENTFSVNDQKATIVLTELTPDTRYFVEVIARDTFKNETKAPRTAFKTLAQKPATITEVSFDLDACQVSFVVSDDYAEPINAVTGYRLSININSKEQISDEIVHEFKRNEKATHNINSLFEGLSVNVGDIIQIGILPWIEDEQGNKVLASQFANYSKPIYVETTLNTVNKLFLRVDDKYKQTIIY